MSGPVWSGNSYAQAVQALVSLAKVLLSNLYTVPETDNFENNKLTSYSLHLTHACTVYVLCMMLIWLNLENNCVTFGIFFVHAC